MKLITKAPPARDFVRLRDITGMSPRTVYAAEKALPASLFAVHMQNDKGEVIGMGRVVGDGVLNLDIVDVAVDPDYQGKGLGRKIMAALMTFIDESAEDGAYVTLMADEPEFYKKLGFKLSRPESEGMYLYVRK